MIAASIALGLSLTAGTARGETPTGPDTEAGETPRGTYVRVHDVPLLDKPDPQAGGIPPHILFLQRCAGGLDLNPGPGGSIADESTIITGPVSLPPFPFGDEAWQEVVDSTTFIFSPFNIEVTDVDPGDVPHDEAVVCGAASDAGFGEGTGGVAPFTCGVIENPITFTFPEALGNSPQLIAEVIGQEAAHAWGLDHELLCEDPMTYLSGCGAKTFQDIDAECGEFEARPCDCSEGTQNSFQHILDTFGPAIPDLEGPIVTVTAPLTGTMFEEGMGFNVIAGITDESDMDRAELFANGQLLTTDTMEPWGWAVADLPPGVITLEIVAYDEHGNEGLSTPISVLMGGEPVGASGGDSASGTDGPGGTLGGSGDVPPDETEGNGLVAGNGDGCGCSEGGSVPPVLAFAPLMLLAGLRRRRPWS